ncbi:MAG: molybdopterin-dependent oxidoreductase [Pseudomonadota bacterium]
MPTEELHLQPLEGLAHWVGPGLSAFVLRLLSMEELPREALTGLTVSQEQFFRRDRHTHPLVDPVSFRLQVTGLATERSFTLADLEALPAARTACVAECAGNGNHLMGSAGLMGQARWEGPKLETLISACGGPGTATHLAFHGADTLGPRGAYHYGLSIEEALTSGAVLALRHGGAPLTRARGFPLRLVAPGIYGMAYVKWLRGIEGKTSRHRGFYNDVLYNNKRLVDGRWEREQARWISLKSVLTRCVEVEGGYQLCGWAWGGGERIARVEVTADGGQSWHEATLQRLTDESDLTPEETRHAWTAFAWTWPTPTPGAHLLTCRAHDEAGRMQPQAEPPDVRGHYDQVRWKWRRVVVPGG